MTLDTLALASLALAALTAGLFLVNLLVYRRLPLNRSAGLRPGPADAGQASRLSPISVPALAPERRPPARREPLLNNQRAGPEAGAPVRWFKGARRSQNSGTADRAGDSEELGDRRDACPTPLPLSVLIPARDEEQNLPATLAAVLANTGADFEVLVLDDHSTDRTAAIVREFAARDARLQLHHSPALPSGWCGKPHACHVLAGLARHPLLVFLDADVRLAPDALARMTAFMQRTPAALASGVPRQELGTFSERLLIPLIQFLLLGYLPMFWARRSKWPAFAAGCGQLFIARAEAYRAAGGHEVIRATLHDGIKLPRAFRRAGFVTDLFDPTDIAVCRMYRTNSEVWRGLGKNATEGLGSPGTILPMTVLLLGGQVLPFVLLAAAPWLSGAGLACAGAAALLAWLPRCVGVARFRQPLASAALHPLGVLALLGIQWAALARQLRGRPASWKGRSYGAGAAGVPEPAANSPISTAGG